jgi:membrane-associated phospholipid phosphatase
VQSKRISGRFFRPVFGRIFLALLFAAGLSQPHPVFAAEKIEATDPEAPSFVRWTYEPWKNLKESTPLFIDRQSQVTLALGTTVFFASKIYDDQARDYFNHKGRLGQFARIGNDGIGTGIPGVIVGGSLWLLGELENSAYFSHSGQAQLEALAVTGILTGVIKVSFQRQRPDGSDYFSFPSGHSSTAFAGASVLTEFYGWKIGVPVYLLAGLTALARLQEDKHWLSDTVGGATIGILVGRAFSRGHLNIFKDQGAPRKAASFTILPAFEPGGAQMVMLWTF